MDVDSTTAGIVAAAVSALVGNLYRIHSKEQDRTRDALDLRVTRTQFTDLRAEFQQAINRVDHDYSQRLAVVDQNQAREVEILTAQINEIKANLAEMRREASHGTAAILQRLEMIATRRPGE